MKVRIFAGALNTVVEGLYSMERLTTAIDYLTTEPGAHTISVITQHMRNCVNQAGKRDYGYYCIFLGKGDSSEYVFDSITPLIFTPFDLEELEKQAEVKA